MLNFRMRDINTVGINLDLCSLTIFSDQNGCFWKSTMHLEKSPAQILVVVVVLVGKLEQANAETDISKLASSNLDLNYYLYIYCS